MTTNTNELTLNGTKYTIAKSSDGGYDLVGARGGQSLLVRNKARPELWCHIHANRRNPGGQWYRLEGATFVSVAR